MTNPAVPGAPVPPPARVPFRYRGVTADGARPEASFLTVPEGSAPDLAATAAAIQEQSFQAFEWLIVRTGGPEAVTRPVTDLSRADPRVRVIDAPGLDGEAARRLGAAAARSQHLWELRSGETPEPTAVEQALWGRESDGSGDSAAFASVPETGPFGNPLDKPAGVRRVLLLVPWLDVSGVEAFAYDLIDQLQPRGHQVSVCATLSGEGRWRSRFAALTPDVFGLPAFLRPVDFPRFLQYLIESRAIDVVVISNSYLAYQLLPFLRSRCPRTAFVDYVHLEAPHWRNGGMARVSVACQELLDLTVVSSEHLRGWMVERGAAAERVEVAYIDVDPVDWDPARFSVPEIRRGLGIPEGEPLLLFAARIVPQKRPELVAEIVRRLVREERLPFACVVAGDGGELPALRRALGDHDLAGRMRFVGIVDPERMQALQAAADVFLLPSRFEGLARTLYEAMAMETVPVAADVGGQRELVTPDCGVLIPPGPDEVDRYVDALGQLLRAPSRRRALAAAGRARIVEHFSVSAMGDRMAGLLERACALARTSPRPPVGPGLGLECATLALEYRRLEGEHARAGRRAAEAEATVETQAARIAALERELAEGRAPARGTRWRRVFGGLRPPRP